jgi:hypothetical protein
MKSNRKIALLTEKHAFLLQSLKSHVFFVRFNIGDKHINEKKLSQRSCETVSVNSENIYKCSIPKFSKISFSISLSDV